MSVGRICSRTIVVARALVTAHEADCCWDTRQRMRSHGTRRIPFVDESQHPVGHVPAEGLLGRLAVELNELVRAHARARAREQTARPSIPTPSP